MFQNNITIRTVAYSFPKMFPWKTCDFLYLFDPVSFDGLTMFHNHLNCKNHFYVHFYILQKTISLGSLYLQMKSWDTALEINLACLFFS